jgi:hypothetical protein
MLVNLSSDHVSVGKTSVGLFEVLQFQLTDTSFFDTVRGKC